MKKKFKIENDSGLNYIVTFDDEAGSLKASCTCQAGQHFTLCKHVIKYMEEDKEIAEALENYGLIDIYNEYLEKKEEAEQLKEEAKNLKKKFARLLLGRYRNKK